MRDKLRDHVIWAEGWRNKPYEDSVGKITIGVGRNLDDVGLSDDEVQYLLKNDLDSAIRDASTLDYWPYLAPARRVAVCDLVFNLGLPRWLKFVNANECLRRRDYKGAAREVLDSRYARQTGRRARKVASLIRTGEFDADGTS